MIGKLILFNPNCFLNIDKILSELKANLKIGDECEWIILGHNGPPFFIASCLTERNPDKYDQVSMVGSLGCLNMNQAKTFFKTNNICLEALGKKFLHFPLPKACNYLLTARIIIKHDIPLKYY